MAKPPRPWIVTRHDPIQKLDDNLWIVEGDVPGIPFRRRMSIVKRSDGTLLFFNAIPLEDAALAEVKAWGKPAVLVVPHEQHMIDARAFAEKLGLKVYGPRECEAKTRTRAEMAGTYDALPSDAALRIEPVAGVKNGEPALLVTSGSGKVSLLVADVLMNSSKESLGLLPRMLGFGGGLKVAPVFRMMFLKDKKALKAQIDRWADVPGLTRLVMSHGSVLPSGTPEALRTVSSTL